MRYSTGYNKYDRLGLNEDLGKISFKKITAAVKKAGSKLVKGVVKAAGALGPVASFIPGGSAITGAVALVNKAQKVAKVAKGFAPKKAAKSAAPAASPAAAIFSPVSMPKAPAAAAAVAKAVEKYKYYKLMDDLSATAKTGRKTAPKKDVLGTIKYDKKKLLDRMDALKANIATVEKYFKGFYKNKFPDSAPLQLRIESAKTRYNNLVRSIKDYSLSEQTPLIVIKPETAMSYLKQQQADVLALNQEVVSINNHIKAVVEKQPATRAAEVKRKEQAKAGGPSGAASPVGIFQPRFLLPALGLIAAIIVIPRVIHAKKGA